MPLWNATSVDEFPRIDLTDWTVRELANGDRHLVGYNLTEHEGRVSSAIREFDVGTMLVRTRSGRVYRLVGESGASSDGEYVWQAWCRVNSVDPQSVRIAPVPA